jgi:hypothetical protein
MSENLNKLFTPVRVVEEISADKVLDVYDTGKVFMLTSSGALTITLPAAGADDITGCCFTFICRTAPVNPMMGGGNYQIKNTVNKIIGTVQSSNGGNASDGQAQDHINFVGGAAAEGDRIEVFCDGTNYYAFGFCNADGGITITED